MADGRRAELLSRIAGNAGLVGAIALLALVVLAWLQSRALSGVRDTQQRLAVVEETLSRLDSRIGALRSEVAAATKSANAQQQKLSELLQAQEDGFRSLQDAMRSPTPRSMPSTMPTPGATPPDEYEPGEPKL